MIELCNELNVSYKRPKLSTWLASAEVTSTVSVGGWSTEVLTGMDWTWEEA